MYLYHISDNPALPRIIKPRVPFIHYKDEPKIKRICVSTSILGCICARYRNTKYKNTDLYLYRVYARELTKPKNVKDANLTQELWILKPAKFELVGKITSNSSYTLLGTENKVIGEYTIRYINGTARTYIEKLGKTKSKRSKQ